MSSRARIGIVLGAVVVLVVAFVIASSSGDDDKKNDDVSAQTQTAAPAPPAETTGGETDAAPAETQTTPAEPAVPVVTVKGGKAVGGIQKLKYTKGDTIEFKVVSDAPGEIHFHGYDIPQEVKAAGGSTTFKVKATIEGRFVVEMEDTGQQIAEVEVDPS